MKTFFIVLLAGIISTVIMDIGSGLSRLSGLTAGAPPELVGKWLQSAMHGRLFVGDIRNSPGEPVSIKTALLYHYSIGIALTFIFYCIIYFFKVFQPVTIGATLGYGLLTTIIPAFLMFPGMGFGILGLQGPPEYLLLRTAIINHLFYGIGLSVSFFLVPPNQIFSNG